MAENIPKIIPDLSIEDRKNILHTPGICVEKAMIAAFRLGVDRATDYYRVQLDLSEQIATIEQAIESSKNARR